MKRFKCEVTSRDGRWVKGRWVKGGWRLRAAIWVMGLAMLALILFLLWQLGG